MEMKKYKLGEICKIASAKRIFEDEYVEFGIPFIRGQEVSDGSLLDENAKFHCYISIERYEELKQQYGIPAKGDILITAVGTIGNLCYLPKNIDFYFKDGNLIWFSNFDKDLYSKYLYFFMKSSIFKNQLNNTLIGAVQKALTMDKLSKIEIELPSLLEQQKIAAVLSSLDDKIALNNRINAKLEQMAKRLYDYWFVQFDFPRSVSGEPCLHEFSRTDDGNARSDFPGTDGKPYKSSGGKMVWNEELKREIPEGWEVGVLSDVANITMGQSPEGSSYNESGEGIVFYQGSTDFGIRFPTVRMYTTAPTRYAKKRDILMSVRAPVGTLNIANSDCCIGRGLAALNSKLNSITHLWYMMDVFKHTFENKNGAGTTFGSITKDELFSLPVVIPPKKIISDFNEKTLSIFNYQLSIEKETQKLTAIRDRLLPLLMNGQVKVN